MKEKTDLTRFLEIVNSQDDLLTLYMRALPFFVHLCDVEKLLFFKFSRRKKCFDIKAGLTKEDVEFIVKGDFENYDTAQLFNSQFNKEARSFGSSCNDIIRSFANLFIDGNVKEVRKSDLPFYKLKSMFDGFGFNGPALLVPFKSRGLIVGFMLLYPVCGVDKILPYISAFACALDKLVLKKSLENLEKVLSERGESLENNKVYQLGKSSMVIAHEMKNALVGIIGLFNKFSGYLKDDEKARRYYDMIGAQLNRIYNFVIDINKYTRFNEIVNLTKVDISEILDDTIEIITTVSKKVRFSVSIAKNTKPILADREQLQQVFLNLFKNSIEACNGSDTIKIDISVKEKDNFIIIRIRDNCGGIDKDKLDKISEPFFTTKSYGTGLGLSIVKSIIENHRGRISFRNVPGGLECVVKLPIQSLEEKNG